MKEATLLKVALTTFLVGIVSLYFFTETMSVQEIPVGKLDGTAKGEMVKILGTVTRSSMKEDVQFLTITQPESVKVFIYKPRQNIPVGAQVEIIGHVDEFKNEKEIIADRIRIVG